MDGNNQYQPFQKHTKSTLGGRGRRITRSGILDQPGQYGETPSQLKIQNLARHCSRHLQSQLLGRLRWKNHLNPGGGVFTYVKHSYSKHQIKTGRFPVEKPRGSPVRLFWPARLFCRRPARHFPVRSVRDGQARLVPSPQENSYWKR
ncbi:hypothetical protein AAY473_012388 [Plecturocebus cupreus]